MSERCGTPVLGQMVERWHSRVDCHRSVHVGGMGGPRISDMDLSPPSSAWLDMAIDYKALTGSPASRVALYVSCHSPRVIEISKQ